MAEGPTPEMAETLAKFASEVVTYGPEGEPKAVREARVRLGARTGKTHTAALAHVEGMLDEPEKGEVLIDEVVDELALQDVHLGRPLIRSFARALETTAALAERGEKVSTRLTLTLLGLAVDETFGGASQVSEDLVAKLGVPGETQFSIDVVDEVVVVWVSLGEDEETIEVPMSTVRASKRSHSFVARLLRETLERVTGVRPGLGVCMQVAGGVA